MCLGYHLRNNIVKDENGDLLADSHNILYRWKNYFSQLLNVHNVSDVRQIEVHMTEPLLPGSSVLEFEIAIAKLKKYKSPSSNEILAELIKAGSEILPSAIYKLMNSVWNKEELPDQWKESISVSVKKRAKKLTVIIIMGYHCYQLHTKLYRVSSSQGYIRMKSFLG
jgi:hypothetical protein